jgi:enamine deaminase RidA (YjgF/YER057c/UK114 family)
MRQPNSEQGRRVRVSSGSPFEPTIGFSRAVRIGDVVAVSGTAPLDEQGQTVGLGDVYAQTRRCLEVARQALEQAGAGLEDVIRTRVLLTGVGMACWREAARAHGEVFADIRPACTFVQVAGFIDERWLVELELDAVCG